MNKIYKICTTCKISKELKEFYNLRTSKDGKMPQCIECNINKGNIQTKTKKGLVTSIYGHQKGNSKRRGHRLPNYTNKELYEWCINQPIFHKLYEDWVNSNYNSNFRPSCDRNKNSLPYSLNNIKLTTWKENKKEGYKDKYVAVRSTNIITGKTKDYLSLKDTEKDGFIISGVNHCCKGRHKTHYGYTWEYI